MSRRPLIAGNWKMHGTLESVRLLINELKRGCEHVELAELAVLVPYIYIPEVATTLMRSQIAWGAQNLYFEPNGAYTGEISASMLADFSCSYVLVGHSERRQLFGETNAVVAKKFHAARQAGLRPILCVGETLAEREAQQTLKIIHEQLATVFDLTDNLSLLHEVVIAYEPVWAIGTGKQASGAQAQDVHAFIRGFLRERDAELAEKVRILYGGSLKPENASELLNQPDVDGGLIGGASLHAAQFLDIGKQCNH